MKATAVTASIAFALAAAAAAAIAWFVLPGTLATLVTEHVGMAPVEFVRSLMYV
jgi:hypothetical protein